MKDRSVRHIFSILLLAALLLAGCSGGNIPQTGSNLPVLALELNDQGITPPQPAAPGLVQVTITNTGQETRSINLARLNSGVTMEQFMQTLATDDLAAVSLVSLLGGTDVEPGTPASFTVNLQSGTYVAISFPQNDGPPTTASFEVSGTASTGLPMPVTQGSVDLLDFSFDLPETIEAGTQTWSITNSGAQWHEIVVFRLQPGQTQEDFVNMLMSDTPPATEPEQVMYFGPISNGEQAWMSFNLDAGNYIAVCFLPDLGSGQSHAELGMVQTFVVP